MFKVQNKKSAIVSLGAGQAHTLATLRSSAVVIHANVHLVIGSGNQASLFCGTLVDILDESVGRVGLLQPVSQCASK